jgi:hypothetical protein
MIRGNVFYFGEVRLAEYYYTQPCYLMLFPGNACDVWHGEIPPGWELEWVDDDE